MSFCKKYVTQLVGRLCELTILVRRRSRITLTSSIYGFLFYFLIIWSLGTPKPVFAKLAKLGKIFYSPLKIWTIFTQKNVIFHFFAIYALIQRKVFFLKPFCIYIVYFSAFHLSSLNCFLEVWAMQCLHFFIFYNAMSSFTWKQCKYWVCTFFVNKKDIVLCCCVVSGVRVYVCNLMMISLEKHFFFI